METDSEQLTFDAATGAEVDDTPPPEPHPFKVGIFTDISHEDYLTIDAFSSSAGKTIGSKSPMHYKFEREHQKPSKAMNKGTALHMAILEPERFATSYTVEPVFNKRTNAGKAAALEFYKDLPAGQLVLNEEDYAHVLAMAEAVHRHDGAMKLLEIGRPEVTLMWMDAALHIPCKCRMDWLRPDSMVDVKSTKDASPDGFPREAANYAYHAQAGHYFNGYEHHFNESPRGWFFIAVENVAPYGVGTYLLNSNAILFGRDYIARAMGRYKDARELGFWPGYSQKIQPLELPRWATQRRWD